MAIIDQIEVRIVSVATAQALPEYDKPNSVASRDDRSVEKFIEAQTGKEFRVEIYLMPNFNLYAASGIKVGLDIDGGTVHRRILYEKADVLDKKGQESPFVISRAYTLEGSKCSAIKFSFGLLELNEDLEVEKTVLDRQEETLGSISIWIKRANIGFRSNPVPVSASYIPRSTSDISKEIFKDKRIKHALQPSAKKSVGTRRYSDTTSYDYKGKNGRPFTFVFRYRSHMDLELLGCKPKVPRLTATLPEPTIDEVPKKRASKHPVIAGQDEKLADTQEDGSIIAAEGSQQFGQLLTENRELKTANGELIREMAALKETKGKMAALIQNLVSDTSTTGSASVATVPVPAPATPTVGVKRERVKEGEQVEGSRRTSASGGSTAKRTKTVDLTAD